MEAAPATSTDDLARRTAGGHRPADLPRGYFFEPTVLSGVRPDMPVFQEEIFGPVMPVVPFDELDEALSLADRIVVMKDGVLRRTCRTPLRRPSAPPTKTAIGTAQRP